MAIDYENPQQTGRLYRAIEWSRARLQPFRENRYAALKEFVGKNYSDSGADDKVPVNLLKLAVGIYLRLLVSRNPRAMVTTRFRQLRAIAEDMEQWATWRIGEMKLEQTLRTATLDALFSIGIIKVGLTSSKRFEWEGQTHYYGEPFADPIDLDDWVHDMAAKRWDQCAFMGHRIKMPLSAAREEPTFSRKARQALQARVPSPYNERGDERAENLQQDAQQSLLEEYTDYVELWEIWLPRERQIITCEYQNNDHGLSGQVLRVVDWEGPRNGPFHILSFMDVPSNTMPSAPVQDWIDLHELANRLFRKLGRQSDRQKTVLAVASSAQRDGENIIKADDGEAITSDFPDRAKEIRFGGVDGPQVAFLTLTKDLFSWFAGNLESVGGLSPQAQTLGQEELLNNNASLQIRDMQDRVLGFTRGVMEALAWYWWNDPIQTYEVERTIPGVEYTTTARIRPQDRQANFLALNFSIAPYSLQASSPQAMAAKIHQLLERILLPAAPMLQAQGIGINFQNLIRRLAKYADIPDLDDLLTFVEAADEPQPSDEPPRKPATSHRTYERISRSAGTTPGKNANLIQTLMGAASPQMAGAAMRPVG